VTEPEQDEPSAIADELTVDAWLDVDRPSSEQPPIVPEPAPAKPGLWARVIRALRGS
jgi:hypothetical protein